MAWRDRDYNRGSEAAREFFSNPAAIMALALPIGRWFGSRVTLHFWLLLTFLFILVDGVRDQHSLASPAIACAVLTFTAMLHDFGHRFMARRVGGEYEEFVLWPFGGMVSPTAPPAPGPMFQANVGGILVNLFFVLASGSAILAILHFVPFFNTWNPKFWIEFAVHYPEMNVITLQNDAFLTYLLLQIFIINLGMLVVNLLPFYWFDGGNLWQAALWPLAGAYRAINITCIAGMVIAAIMFFLSLWASSFMCMILWMFLFSSAYVRRQSLKAAGPEELQNALSYNETYQDSPPLRTRAKRRRKSWFRSASRKAANERAEQARIDAILEKVHNLGLHSLTWREKRALRKATERQRRRERDEDLAGRL